MNSEQVKDDELKRYAVHTHKVLGGMSPVIGYIDARNDDDALALACSHFGSHKVSYVKEKDKSMEDT
jgi:hypothetical protein